KRFVVSRHRTVLQTFRHIQPGETIFVQNESRIAGNRVESGFVPGWSKLGRFFDGEIRVIETRPFTLCPVPPDQFLLLAPRFTRRRRARFIIYEAQTPRQGKPPAVSE